MMKTQLTGPDDVSPYGATSGAAVPPRSDPWVAALAHELRNPLNAILMALHAMGPDRADVPMPDATRDVIERVSLHMGRVIDDVLDLSRGAQGKLSLRRETVDLRRVIAGAMEAARPLLAAGAHRLSVSLPPDPVTLRADGSRLQQVLTNLLTNAARYTDPGGRISLTVSRESDRLVIVVRDNGIGIAPEALPGIFDLYRQEVRAGRPSRGGLGIGLALVKSLVDLHGGTVEASSDGPGKGAEFVVRLPMGGAEGEAAAGGEGGRARVYGGANGRRSLCVSRVRGEST